MLWMEERAGQRGSPAGLWPEVQSVMALRGTSEAVVRRVSFEAP